MIVRLSIYAVNGTGTQYNSMASELHNNTSNAYSKIAKYTPGTQSSKKRQLSKHNIKENHRNIKNTKFNRKNKIKNNKSKFGGTRSDK
ncbi:hypothetical protein [Spiroplasma endosymbiont of Colias croceus]|uniref:hypothetical protein n=1 Tax=Spiroplasma endosymbiont of Colias croceus TaxID=3066310 RepID=UPI0030D41767